MKRTLTAAAALSLVLMLLVVSGCQKKIDVRTGTRVVCTYGHAISDNTKIVSVPVKNAGDYNIRTVTRICEQHAKLEALYKQAQDALRKGDLAAAKKALTQVVAIDQAYGKAQDQLDQIAAGKKPKPDENPPSASDPGTGGGTTPGGSGTTTDTTPGGSGTTTETPGGGNVSGPVDGLRRWTPNTLTGYTASKPAVDVLNIARQYVPADNSDVLTLVIVAEQFRTAADAKAGLQAQVKNRYTKNRETVTFNGHSAFYGTDGRKFAALGFTNGAVMVALEMSVKSGSPTALRTPIIAAAKQLP